MWYHSTNSHGFILSAVLDNTFLGHMMRKTSDDCDNLGRSFLIEKLGTAATRSGLLEILSSPPSRKAKMKVAYPSCYSPITVQFYQTLPEKKTNLKNPTTTKNSFMSYQVPGRNPWLKKVIIHFDLSCTKGAHSYKLLFADVITA